MKFLPAYYSSAEDGKISSHIRNTDFVNLDFHPLKSTLLSTLNFEIRTPSGEASGILIQVSNTPNIDAYSES